VIEAARSGNEDAREVLRVSARKLGRGIALLLDLLNPEVVVLGSLAVRAGDLILPLVDETVRWEATAHAYSACRIVPAALGARIGDVASLCPPIYRATIGTGGS
jgi:glucokinase